MNKELLEVYKGRHVSLITKKIPHPTSGVLENVIGDYTIINPHSPNVEKVIIMNEEIVSVLVGKNEVKHYGKNETDKRQIDK